MDHPRGCGENVCRRNHRYRRTGSPPRMRGKHLIAGILLDRIRITPADAGKTCFLSPLFLLSQDHPRGCGENFVKLNCPTALPGSPPRMRGKRWVRGGLLSESGITPAGAGKTTSHFSHTKLLQDHPRRCGENRVWDTDG